MKRKIGALTAALGLAMAIPAMAYPNASGTAGTGNNAGSTGGTTTGTMNSQGTTSGTTTGTMNSRSNNHPIERVKLEELPQTVQTTINQHMEGGHVKHIARVTQNGQTFYEVSLKNSNGGQQQFKVDANGQYLGPQTTGQNINQNNANTTPQSGNTSGGQIER